MGALETLFSWTSAQYGLAVGLLIVGLVLVGRFAMRKDQEARALLLKENEEIKAERDYYRTLWIEAVGAAEVGAAATQRLARGRRPSGGR